MFKGLKLLSKGCKLLSKGCKLLSKGFEHMFQALGQKILRGENKKSPKSKIFFYEHLQKKLPLAEVRQGE